MTFEANLGREQQRIFQHILCFILQMRKFNKTKNGAEKISMLKLPKLHFTYLDFFAQCESVVQKSMHDVHEENVKVQIMMQLFI